MKTRNFAKLSYTSAAATFYVNGTEFTERAAGESFCVVSYSTHDGLGHESSRFATLAPAVEFADGLIDMMVERMYFLRAIDTSNLHVKREG